MSAREYGINKNQNFAYANHSISIAKLSHKAKLEFLRFHYAGYKMGIEQTHLIHRMPTLMVCFLDAGYKKDFA